MRRRKFTINVPIYKTYIDVSIGDGSLGVAGKVDVYTDGSFKMRLNGFKNLHNTLPHEISHIVFHILERAGLKLSVETEEAFAYLTGFLHEEFHKKLKHR